MSSTFQKLKILSKTNDLDSFFKGNKLKTTDFQHENEKMMIYSDEEIQDFYQILSNLESENVEKMVYILAKLAKPVQKKVVDPGRGTGFIEYSSEMFEFDDSSTFINDDIEGNDLDRFTVCDGFGAFSNIAGENLSLPKLLKNHTLVPQRTRSTVPRAVKSSVTTLEKKNEKQSDSAEPPTDYRSLLKLDLKRRLLSCDEETMPQYQTETNYFRGFYEKFMLHPYLTRQDMNLVPQNDLIEKLLNAFLGMNSDLFDLTLPNFFKLDFIRIETIGSKSLMQFLSKFLKSAQVLKRLQEYASIIEIRSLTGASLSSALRVIIRIVHLNIIKLQSNHKQSPIPILQLYQILQPIQILTEELETDFLSPKNANLNDLLSNVYNRLLSLPLNHLYTPYLLWIFRKSTQPLFSFISGYISNSVNDPFHEFFIVDGQYFPNLVPTFIPESLTKRLFELRHYDNNSDLLIEFCPSWVINQDERKVYLAKFDHMIRYKRDLYRDKYLQMQMEHLNNLQEEVDKWMEERRNQEVRLGMIYAQGDRQREEVEGKKRELKISVEKFLEEQKRFKEEQEQLRLVQDREKITALDLENAERERLMNMEREQIVIRFETALKDLEKKEALLEWRQKRIDLNIPRKAALSQTLDYNSYNFPEPTNPTFQEIASSVCREQESFYSAKVDLSKDFIHNLDDNSNDTNPVEQVLITQNDFSLVKKVEMLDNASSQDAMTDIIIEDINSCPPSPASVETLLPPQQLESGEIVPTPVDANELNDIQWVLYPGTVANCFGKKNDFKKDSCSSSAFDEIQKLKTALMDIDGSMQTLEQIFYDSVLEPWCKELELISFSCISCFFSPKGPNCPDDLRFHLELIKNYFLLGSPLFSMAISDAMFKDTPLGLNLNGCKSNRLCTEVNILLLEILQPLDWLDFDITGLKNGNDITNQGQDVSADLRIKYEPPAPFDIILNNNAIEKFSRIFSFLLLLFQAQDAIERIYQSPRLSKGETGENCIMIKFIHMSHVFLTSFEHYVFHSAINFPWELFLKEVETLVSSSSILSYDGSVEVSVENMQLKFDNCADEILWRLFLFDRDQRILSHQIVNMLKLLIEFSRSVQHVGTARSFARLFFDFEAGFNSLLTQLKDCFQREEFSENAYQKSFEPFYELFIGLGGEI